MPRQRAFHAVLVSVACLLLVLWSFRLCEAAAGKMTAGMSLPGFTLEGAASADFQKYLGLKESGPFKVSDVSGKFVLIDILNAF